MRREEPSKEVADRKGPQYEALKSNKSTFGHIRPSAEKILRKTVEVIERPYLTVQPQLQKPTKRERRRSLVLTRCEDLMEALWEDGFRREIPWHKLRDYIVETVGGFRTTVADYLGKRATYYAGLKAGVLKTPRKVGYLERFGFIEKKTPRMIILHHERVRRGYHCEQTSIVSFSLSNSTESNERNIGLIRPTNTTNYYYIQRERENQKSTRTTQKPQLTKEEQRILRAAKKDGEAHG